MRQSLARFDMRNLPGKRVWRLLYPYDSIVEYVAEVTRQNSALDSAGGNLLSTMSIDLYNILVPVSLR